MSQPQPTTTMEKEALKESTYRAQVQSLLRKHTPTFISTPTDTKLNNDLSKQYQAEQALINRIVANETTAFMYGIALSGVVFASVRFGPRWLTRKIGGVEKEKAMRDAEEKARKAGNAWIQKGLSFMIEVSFGAWAGWRGYSIVSSQNNDSFEAIAQIPLCAGRSTISDKVCTEWVNLVHNQIPQPFWQNLDSPNGSKLQEEARWRSVRDFADNCVKRKAFEDAYRKEFNMSDGGAVVVVPEGGVPRDILTKLHLEKKNNEEKRKL